jgi:hypothetical protein
LVTNVADDMGGMKRIALVFGALGMVWFSALAGGSAHAQQPSYPPGLSLTLVAEPDEVQTNAVFDAILTGCFPGETVTFFNLQPYQQAQAICDDTTYTASVEFTASATTGTRFISAYIPALNSTDPDVPSLPPRLIFATYSVVTTIVVVPTSGTGEGTGTSIVSPPSSDDWWPSFLSSSAILRSFLGLLALLAGIFFVVLWRRRREEEEQIQVPPGRIVPPTEPPRPTLA